MVARYLIAGSTTAAETLVFLHGLGGDATNWNPQLRGLDAPQRRIAWTMPGYNDSPALVGEVTWPALADAVVEMLDHLGIERATLVGLSMGGMVAMQTALDHPSRVDGLVLVATTAAFGRPGSTFADRYLASRLAPLDRGSTPADLAPTTVDALLGPVPDAGARPNAIASMSKIRSAAYRRALGCLVTWDIADRLGELAVPTLCVAGADDTIAPVASMERLCAGIDGATFTVVPECGHLVNLERPAQFNRLLAGVDP